MVGELEIIKKPYLKETFTAEQAKEIAKCSNDPVFFIEKYLKIQHPLKGRVPFKMYPFQKKMVEGFYNHKDVVCLCARQMGKCVTFDTIIKVDNIKTKIGNLVKLSFKDKIVSYLERMLIKLAS